MIHTFVFFFLSMIIIGTLEMFIQNLLIQHYCMTQTSATSHLKFSFTHLYGNLNNLVCLVMNTLKLIYSFVDK